MRASILVTTIFLGAVVLSGCAAEQDTPDLVASATPSDSVPDDMASPPSASPVDPGLIGIPVQLNCVQVLTGDALYSINPNVGTDPAYAATALAQQALGLNGIACGWLNQTSAVTYSVAVAQLDSVGIAYLRDAASSQSSAVPLVNADGFFTVGNDGGTAQAFIGAYWVIIESQEFIAPGDVNALLEAVSISLS